MRIYNTLSRSIEDFRSLEPHKVTLYTCGFTVYDYTHIGHMRKYIGDDLLKRALKRFGYEVNHVQNITDVGHLASDADAGEDKMEKGAKKYGKTVWEVAQHYTEYFNQTMTMLNVLPPSTLCKATDHVQDMIKLIKVLEEKGYAYTTDEAVYFDITKFEKYGELSKQKLEEKMQAARDEVVVDQNKKHPADFALWFKRVGRFADHVMHWDSPWGEGFPGWHIECSAMSMKYLGETLDIHTGGIDHIPVHHENEIAQSEAATGKTFVQYWVHHNFLQVNGEKMSKSLDNFYTIDDVRERGINPMALRLLFMQVHYRQSMNFTWDAAKGADEAYRKLQEIVISLRKQTERTVLSEEKLKKVDEYRRRFDEAIANDLQTPQAVAVMWELLKSNVPSEDKLDLLLDFDSILGLKLSDSTEEVVPEEVQELAKLRITMRNEKQFEKADEIRKQIEAQGYVIEDQGDGFRIKKK
jgi:cysteinyl-tRNA synthetase